MKNLRLGISALALTIAASVSAQTTSNPWLIGVGAHGVNHKAAYDGMNKFFDNLTDKPLWSIRNYSIIPPLSKLTVARNLNKYLVLDWQTSVGNVDNKRFNMGKEFFLMTGLGLQFKVNGLWNEESWFDPYVRVGANYLRHDYRGLSFPRTDVLGHPYGAYDADGNLTGKANHFTVAGGLGSNFWITKSFGLGVQGDYVVTPTNKSDVANFWQASASLLFRFGNTDRDKDGIPDKEDRCPDTPGLPEFQGCPDTDGDGIPDIDDKCPEVAGPKENEGCPWPDTDGDGVLDKDDQCPTVPGPKENNGCPWPDYAKEATVALKDILFNFNKATLRPESNDKLDQAAKIIKDAKNSNFLIVGMTDKKGSDAYNLKLSRERAAAVVKALEARGVTPDALKSIGIGSQEATVPASASDAERMVDRKVIVRAITGAEWDTYTKNDVTVAKPVITRKATAKKATAKKAPAKKAPAKKKK